MKARRQSSAPARDALAALTRRLQRRYRRVTGPRQAILEILRQRPHPMTNKEIFAAMRKGHCDLATVYRSMHLLEELGIVKRCDFADGVARFELLEEGDDGHHHHLVCLRCAQIVELADCFPPELEQKIAERNGFTAITHKLEFFGICPQCQSA